MRAGQYEHKRVQWKRTNLVPDDLGLEQFLLEDDAARGVREGVLDADAREPVAHQCHHDSFVIELI